MFQSNISNDTIDKVHDTSKFILIISFNFQLKQTTGQRIIIDNDVSFYFKCIQSCTFVINVEYALGYNILYTI